MKAPSFLFPHTVTIKPFSGTTAYGEKYGTSFNSKARVIITKQFKRESKSTQVKNSQAKDANIKLMLPESTEITRQSIVTYHGNDYEVTDVMEQAGIGNSLTHKVAILS